MRHALACVKRAKMQRLMQVRAERYWFYTGGLYIVGDMPWLDKCNGTSFFMDVEGLKYYRDNFHLRKGFGLASPDNGLTSPENVSHETCP